MIFKLAGSILILSLAGCANQAELTQLSNTSVAIASLQYQALQSHKDTLNIDCTKGCGSAIISYTDPRDLPKVTGMRVRGTNDVIVEAIPPLTNAFTSAVIGVSAIRIMDDAFHAAGGNNTEVHNNSIINGENNSNDMSATTSKSTADNNTSSNDNNQDNDVANTDSYNSNDNNQADSNNDNSQVDSNDNNSSQDDNSLINQDDNSQQNQTATPTVVNPVVVQ